MQSKSFLPLLALCLVSLAAPSVSQTTGRACGLSRGYEPRTREYWVAAVEKVWDYVPLGINNSTGEAFDESAKVFTENGEARIGSKYLKALFVEYTKDFGEQIDRESNDLYKHMGFLGPAIRGVVGDKIIVHFKNEGTMDYSIHAHGVKYEKAHEGAPYNDGTGKTDKMDDVVAPGGTFDYEWEVRERSGPGKNGLSSQLWAYHSHVDVPTDIYSGLVGPLVVVNPAYITTDEEAEKAFPCDLDREFFMYYSVSDENNNRLFDSNVGKVENAVDLGAKEIEELAGDDDFVESNLMHGINGYMYANLPGLVMKAGDRVRWYIFSFGTEVDLHGAHWHGNTLDTASGQRVDSFEIFPGSFAALDMVPDAKGTWLVVCHTHDHLSAGMMAFYTVT
ncbi:hypothetical protein BSKO_06770 [Bryopsis sp. KO-2023]|nr:hypothetical protein BSKO_06770 [Bryopsis sp. KO-2023]